ncbi:MAG: hypothetical protein M1820_003111 [Bogoriella megaspora]|nr:MAG: hypothetical protein M1820_003111 [Bogoriella megaspora]
MSTNGKRISDTILEDNDLSREPYTFPSRAVKQTRLEESLDVHELRDLSTDRNPNTGQTGHHASFAEPTVDADNVAVLDMLKAKIMDLEAKLSLVQAQVPPEPANFYGEEHEPPEFSMTASAPVDPLIKRKSARPVLNRVSWVGFKNLYLDEDIFAIDVLMGPPKFYWQRRSEEREMRDRMEAAKSYDVESKEKTLEREKEKATAKIANITPEKSHSRKEIPERIRINSQPLQAILSDITGEYWSGESIVMLRPYKLLVAYENEIRERLRFLQKLWKNRPRPNDVTTSAGQLTAYEQETMDDDFILDEGSVDPRQHSDTSSTLSREQRRYKRDLTTTYDALQDLACLVEFMDEEISPITRRYAHDSSYSRIYFRDLWYLYQPGDWVVLDERRGKRFSPDAGPEDDRPPSQPGSFGERNATIWRVLRTGGGRPKLSPPNKYERNRPPSSEVNPFSVRCYRIDYDGDRFGPIWVNFDFQPWEGEKSIEQLEVVPIRLTKNATEKRNHYVARGKQFMELIKPQHRIYSGPLLNFHPSGLLFEHESPGQRDVYGSVIVDFTETARVNPKMVMRLGIPNFQISDDTLTITEDYPLYVWDDRKGGIWREGSDDILNDSYVDAHLKHKHIRRNAFLSRYENLLQGDYIDVSEFGDDEYVLLPNRVCAYILQRRRFAILRLDCLRLQGQDSQNWDDLILTRDNKETVKAQTLSHFRNKRLRASNPDIEFDLSREKGLGLVILLHGVPGVGKTSTAECVAQLLGKPLFPITCGDLGTSAELVEQQLYEIFGKAEKWDCVLLLDEADVFLASRGKNDLKRNAVVSVFLRILELYTGILFLTTNRIGVLDEAFMSRIHTQLYYPPLEEGQSMKIWDTNLRKLQKRKRGFMQMDIEQILSFAHVHFEKNIDKSTRWNGRQIRNACQAAAALAEHEAFGSDEGIYTNDSHISMPIARLDVRHFQKVDNAMREFYDYMANVCGEGFSGVAKMRSERDDDYEPPRRHSEQLGYEHGPPPNFRRSPRLDAYSPEEGMPPYGGGFSTQRNSSFSPHEQRSRHRWSSFARDQDRSHFG